MEAKGFTWLSWAEMFLISSCCEELTLKRGRRDKWGQLSVGFVSDMQS